MMAENAIYEMVLKDFQRFPEMWQAYVERRSIEPNPIQAVAMALKSHDLEEAARAYARLPETAQKTPTGQIGLAMIEYATSKAT